MNYHNRSKELLKCIFFISVLYLLLSGSSLSAQSRVEPVKYPVGVIGDTKPYFIWQNLYHERDKKSDVKYRLTIQNKSGSDPVSYIFQPDVYYKYFFVYRISDPLGNNIYQYKIERLLNNKPISSRHYYYLKYPVTGEFTIDNEEKSRIDDLHPDYLIKYLYLKNHNVLENGYNFLFFSTSSTITLAVGILFYKYLDFGTVSKVIYVLCFGSSAFGYTASAIYGYRYMKNKSKLNKILEIGSSITIKGGIIDNRLNSEIELRY